MPYYRSQPRDDAGRWTKKKVVGGALGTALLAGLMAAANGGDVTTSVGAALDAATSQSTVDAETASSRQAAQGGDETEAWRRMALKEIKKDVKNELRCSVQSFGQVRQFFLSHPCNKLDQLLFEVSDSQGDVVIGSVMWVAMPSADSAAQFLRLEDTYGTGDVTPFGTEVLEIGGIRFTGKHYKSRPDGKLVVISETEPVRGQPSNTLLQEVATVADVLPPP
jgi:hypothetical protein